MHGEIELLNNLFKDLAVSVKLPDIKAYHKSLVIKNCGLVQVQTNGPTAQKKELRNRLP